MPKRHVALVRDDDLDHRPFGDSHFGDAGPDRRRLERPRLSASGTKGSPRAKCDGSVPFPTPSLYSWHDGFFEDLDPRSGRRPTRKRAGRPSKAEEED